MKPLIVAFGLLVGTLNASTSISSDIEYATTTNPTLIELQQSTSTLQDKMAYYANKHHLEAYKANQMVSTIKCESNFNPTAVSSTNDYGISQINTLWGFSKTQMFDVDFSLNFMAYQFSIGNEHYWVCYNKLYEKSLL